MASPRHASPGSLTGRFDREVAMPRARQREKKPKAVAEPIPVPEQLFDEMPPASPEDIALAAASEAPEGLFGQLAEDSATVEPTEGLFDYIPQAAPAAGIVDADLSDAEREEFAKLLRAEVPLAERAKLLGRLARMKDTKRAPVGLRAIQEINRLTGVGAERPVDTMPMFVLGAEQSIAVDITPVKK